MAEDFSVDIEETKFGALESQANHRSTSIVYSSGYNNAFNSICFVIFVVKIVGNALIDNCC